MEEALKQGSKLVTQGEIVKGTVIEVRPKEVLVDIGYKSEGVIPANEFIDIKEVKVGQEIDVLIEKLENKEGTVVLSHEKAEFKKNWERILSICNEGGRVMGKVKSVVKGGLVVNVGVEAFLPASQLDVITPKNLQSFVGNSYEFKVVKINQDRQNIVLSRRELIEAERNEKRGKLLGEMTPGDIRKGTVKNITDFGAFIDLNGLDGLLHITDMSWGRLGHPSEILKVGQELDVVVLDVNKEKERVSLGLKQKMANPWDQIENKFPIGTKVKGKVVSLVPYGAFVQLEPGVEGLVHVTELSWTKRVAKPSDVLKQDQEIEAVVLGINRDEQKISLGVRQLESNPWDSAADKYKVGERVKGKVRNLTSYGAFVELEEGIDGMVHVSDMSWTRKINHPSEVLKKGDDVEATVLEVDRPNQRIALGMKQLEVDPWENIEKLYKVGDLVTGKVTKLASFRGPATRHRRSGAHLPDQRRARGQDQKCAQGRPGRERPRSENRQRRTPYRPVHQGRQLHGRADQGRAEDPRRAQARRRPRCPATRLRRAGHDREGINFRNEFKTADWKQSAVFLFVRKSQPHVKIFPVTSKKKRAWLSDSVMSVEPNLKNLKADRDVLVKAIISLPLLDAWTKVRQILLESSPFIKTEPVPTIYEGPTRAFLLPLPYEVLIKFIKLHGDNALTLLLQHSNDSSPLLAAYSVFGLFHAGNFRFVQAAQKLNGRNEIIFTLFGCFAWEGTLSEYAHQKMQEFRTAS